MCTKRPLSDGRYLHALHSFTPGHGVQRWMISVDNFFVLLGLFFCFVVAICDLVHAEELCIAFLKC